MGRSDRVIEYEVRPEGPPSRRQRIFRLLFGPPLASRQGEREQLGAVAGVPVFGLDALASAAYGPEAALTVLLPLGLLGVWHLLPITAVIVAILGLVFLSYRQTIEAYPSGGGSYTVARVNLGARAGLLAAAALALDYMLNVAVAISAGVGALVSAVPALQRHQLPLCLATLALITLVNLRGFRSTGAAFMAPTYLFVASLACVVGVGLLRVVLAHGHPTPVEPPVRVPALVQAASPWLVLRAFGSGCTAMTGVEAVSNGVPAFLPPATERARRCLSIIIGVLVVLLLGIGLLVRPFGVTATQPDAPGYRSVLSQLTAAVLGHGLPYYVTMAAVVAVLMLSANTSFAGFPRLCRMLANDGYLPEPFVHQGRRMAFTYGIWVLAAISAGLLWAFHGITNGLIPLFAVGAFLAFTMSQAGMVMHWRRHRVEGSGRSLAFNALGAIATGLTLLVVVSTKWVEGAWLSVLLIAVMLVLFAGVKHHNESMRRATHTDEPLAPGSSSQLNPVVVVPLRRWSRVTRKALQFAVGFSNDVYAVQVLTGDRACDDLSDAWGQLVERPCEEAGRPAPRLVVLQSDFRELFAPLEAFVLRLTEAVPRRCVAVVIPELVERRWYHYLFHSYTASILRDLLVFRGSSNLFVIEAPWYWKRQRGDAPRQRFIRWRRRLLTARAPARP